METIALIDIENAVRSAIADENESLEVKQAAHECLQSSSFRDTLNALINFIEKAGI